MSASEQANSHAGTHGDFRVFWNRGDAFRGEREGWYWFDYPSADIAGPFDTSQAAFGNRKDQIDGQIKFHA